MRISCPRGGVSAIKGDHDIAAPEKVYLKNIIGAQSIIQMTFSNKWFLCEIRVNFQMSLILLETLQ